MIEHYEDPEYNWRRSFLTGLEVTISDLKAERRAQTGRRIYVGTKVYCIDTISDADLEMVARRELERTTDRAIIQRRMDAERRREKNADDVSRWQRGAGPEVRRREFR